jgi:hypothetical protein
LVHEQKCEKNDKIHFRVVGLVDECKYESAADREREGAHGAHSDEDLKDQFVGIGNSIGMFESEEFERLDEQTHDDGAHEERTGATQEASDGHDLESLIRL